MKKILSLFVLSACLVLLYSFAPRAGTGECGSTGTGPRKSAGPPSCVAGEPPLRTTCTTSGCHETFALNSGTAILKLDIDSAENGYALGHTYDIKVSLSKTGLVRGGFQLIALQDNDENTTPGIITLTNATTTQVINAANPHAGSCTTANKTWVEHTIDGIDNVQNSDSLVWHFNWTAPNTDVGNVTFYVAALEANQDLDNTGDHVYSLQKRAPSLTTGILETAADKIVLFPNPSNDMIYLRLPNNLSNSITDKIIIHNTLGQEVLQSALTNHLSVAQLPSGYYLITITLYGQRQTLPFLKH